MSKADLSSCGERIIPMYHSLMLCPQVSWGETRLLCFRIFAQYWIYLPISTSYRQSRDANSTVILAAITYSEIKLIPFVEQPQYCFSTFCSRFTPESGACSCVVPRGLRQFPSPKNTSHLLFPVFCSIQRAGVDYRKFTSAVPS